MGKGLFWVHSPAKRGGTTKRLHQRKADGQDFHERLSVEGLLGLLSRGGITLCGLEAAEKNREEAKA